MKESNEPATGSPTASPLRFLLPIGIGVALFLVAVWAAPFRHQTHELAYFALLYLALGCLIYAVLLTASGVGRLFGLLACLLAGAAIPTQLRLDAEVLGSKPLYAGASLGLGLLFWLLLGISVPRGAKQLRPARALGLTLLCGAAFGGLVAYGLFKTEGLRWHLFHHHRLIGHPAYFAFSEPIGSLRRQLWRDSDEREPYRVAPTVVELEPAGGSGSPHIVFLLVDTWRADSLAVNGGDPEWMPTLNALAEQGTTFTNLHSNASWTRASVASIFTGLQPEEHGAVRLEDQLDPGWRTLAEVMRDAGYRTAAVVSNWVHIGIDTGFDQGFDEFRQPLGDEDAEGRGKYARAELINELALEWLQETLVEEPSSAAEPFFLYLHYLDPHSPYLSGPEEGLRGDSHVQKRGAYRQELRYFDAQFAQLRSRLDELLSGPVLYVITSDHGEEFWEHGDWGHGHSLYREQIWVPGIVFGADGATTGEGGTIDAGLEGRDLYHLVAQAARPGPFDAAAWARERAREVRYSSQFLDRAATVRPDKKRTAMRRIDVPAGHLIWSAYGPSWQYFPTEDADETTNRVDQEKEQKSQLEAHMNAALRFYGIAPKVVFSEERMELLRALGYAGETPEDAKVKARAPESETPLIEQEGDEKKAEDYNVEDQN